MSRFFPAPSQVRKQHPLIDAWANRFELHPAVAIAIHSIADDYDRTFEDICESPTADEVRTILNAITEYVGLGDFPMEEFGAFKWGKGSIRLPDGTATAA